MGTLIASILLVGLLILLVRRLILFPENASRDGWRSVLASPGEQGELRVADILSRLPEEYRVFNDVYLESNGYSSQIDHVVISQYGVFLIETKNYSGKIYGNENAKYWKQYLRRESHKFYNPIKQNQSHVLAIKNTLHVDQSSIIPIVVFLSGADLHCNTSSEVLYTYQLYDNILNHNKIAFTLDGVERLSRRLSDSIVTDSNRRISHIQSIHSNIAEREQKIARRICPQCNGQLIERHGRYGRFLGCSNYPYCKFTAQL